MSGPRSWCLRLRRPISSGPAAVPNPQCRIPWGVTMSEIHATTHRHPEDGGWLRPAVFGAMDGLVSNFALIMGVFGGSAAITGDLTPVILAGFAGLAAGAFSMAAGEYTSVASQAEFIDAQINVERREIRDHAPIEQAELAERFVALGIDR